MPSVFRTLTAALALGAATTAASAAPFKARVETGVVVGEAEAGVEAFKGIPYAQPPVGPLRWRPPQPARPWSGERPAADFGHSCIQTSSSPNVSADSAAAVASEDCLTLNVWAPAHPAGKAPVMVWIHGGGNTNGSSADSYYDGSAFARDGVVLVSINYRLGVFGFFAHPALTAEAAGEATGDFGLMDQVAALNWVKRNVAAFGGDPGNVTVFGESAGGEDVLLLLTAPSARGLFQKAISESAGHWTGLPDLAKAEAAGKETASRAGIAGDATAAQLRALPAKALMDAGERLEGGPMVDGRFLPVQPIQAYASGAAIHVPLMIGTNGNEGSLLGPSPPNPEQRFPEFKDRLERVRTAYGDKAKDGATFARLLFRDQFFSAPSRFVAE
jgi:para-nitrobenzyl esterase